MDGFKKELTQSLQFRLSVWLSGVIALVAVAAGGYAFVSAYQEAIEFQDEQLRQIALIVSRQTLTSPVKEVVKKVTEVTEAEKNDSEFRVVVQELKKVIGSQSGESGELAELPPDSPEGFQTVQLQSESWRIFVKTLNSGARVAVGQPTEVRDDIAQANALRTLIPFGMLILILVVLVGYLIRQIFKPIKAMAHEVNQRNESDLTALSNAKVPTEIRPFVVAINRLLGRVEHSVAVQRRFVADAAHELRSPLTALSLQAERLAEADMSTEASTRLATLRKGIDRNRNLLNQLLTLARAQEPTSQCAVPVSVKTVYRQVLEDLMPLAEAKSIDLGVVGEQDVSVMATQAELYSLIKNLLDNAIRHTPLGGRVDLSVQLHDKTTYLEVSDTGPGIPVHERERVFEAFYRILGHDEDGSGLGLSIVKTIATRNQATVQLHFTNEAAQTGLRVQVIFPN